jgi:Zn-dependent protease
VEIQAILLYGVLLVSLVVHEAAHALVAYWGGDKTAYYGGQVTLNPIPHIRREPFGTVILPLLLLISSGGTMCMGFAHAPVDAVWAHRNPRKAALMSAAGPLSNFLLVLITLVVVKILMAGDILQISKAYDWFGIFVPTDGATSGPARAAGMICGTFIFLNLLLGILNLIPVPPLDGAGVIGGLFPRSVGRYYESMRAQPSLSLILMIGVFYLFYQFGFDIVVTVFNWCLVFL